jgi:hypothetical protein
MSLIKRGLYIAITEKKKGAKPLNAHHPFYDITGKQPEIGRTVPKFGQRRFTLIGSEMNIT